MQFARGLYFVRRANNVRRLGERIMLGHSGRLANNVRPINNVIMQIAGDCTFARDPEDVPSRDHSISDWWMLVCQDCPACIHRYPAGFSDVLVWPKKCQNVFKNAFKSLHSVIFWYTSTSGKPAGYLWIQAGQSRHTSFPIRHGTIPRWNIFRISRECTFSSDICIITLFIGLTLFACRPLWPDIIRSPNRLTLFARRTKYNPRANFNNKFNFFALFILMFTHDIVGHYWPLKNQHVDLLVVVVAV